MCAFQVFFFALILPTIRNAEATTSVFSKTISFAIPIVIPSSHWSTAWVFQNVTTDADVCQEVVAAPLVTFTISHQTRQKAPVLQTIMAGIYFS